MQFIYAFIKENTITLSLKNLNKSYHYYKNFQEKIRYNVFKINTRTK